ncbi:basic salivary proline-rich protein 1-like [Numida meleagris]|uniref:basic salivary proline-rich protein 1-like n=1 Tax=Numida meleagris TaxID=8996 RepID=UPI000B3DBB93|nr:basic salivary proline-rich protein 1-like [Numida meleagris]
MGSPPLPAHAHARPMHTRPLSPDAPGCTLHRQTKGRRRAGPQHRAHPAGTNGPAGPGSPCPPAPAGLEPPFPRGGARPAPAPPGSAVPIPRAGGHAPGSPPAAPSPLPAAGSRRPYLPPPHRLSPRRPPASSAHGRAAILRLTNYCTSFGAGGRRPSRELPTPPGPSPRRRPRRPLASSRRLAAPGRPRGEDGQRRPCLCLPRRERGRSRSPPRRRPARQRRTPGGGRSGPAAAPANLAPGGGCSAGCLFLQPAAFRTCPALSEDGPEPPCHGRMDRQPAQPHPLPRATTWTSSFSTSPPSRSRWS